MRLWKAPAAAAALIALSYLFGGVFGLIFGAILVVASVLGRIPPRGLWILAVLLMALAPFALMAQGLPSGPVVGPTFGSDHLLAHALVGMSLGTAAWAGLLELMREKPEAGAQPPA